MKNGYCLLLIILFCACSANFQRTADSTVKKTYRIHTLAFYNLENLFDTHDEPHTFDETSPLMELPAAVRTAVYWKKNRNMAKVISEIGKEITKQPPVLVGVAEVENKKVLHDLVNDPHLKLYDYGIIHYDSPDLRGIDVALLYRKKHFHPLLSSSHEVVIYDINQPGVQRFTRDVLLVTGLLEGDTLNVLVNHWPSRFGGEKRSRPNREKAAAVNKRLVDSLLGGNPYAKIIIMGDMNDGPYNTSIKNILNAKADQQDVESGGLFNPMANMQKKGGLGTIGYQDSWDLFDQIIISRSLLNKDYTRYRYYKAGIYNPDYLITPDGRYKGYPFRSYANGQFTGGYSDHFPVYIYLIKEGSK